MKLAPTLAVLGLLSLGCALTDVKGDSCSADDMFEAPDGDRYCRDADAPADCEVVVDAIIGAFVTCGDGAFTEDELRLELAKEGVTFHCEDAVATSLDYDTCLDQLADPECKDNLAVISDECEGSVLAPE